MKSKIVLISVVFCLLCMFSTGKSALAQDPFRGIPPQDENYYRGSSGTIKCKDGSKKFSIAQLNDDFCDCPDGTDEPGTSACPGGKFHCRNAGHIPLSLFSSRVNDGICDCCDGSDEYDGKVKCPNTCWEAGKAARDKLKKKITTYKEGVALRRKEVDQAKIAMARDEDELSKLKHEVQILKGLVEQLKERKEQMEKAEEKARLQREKEEKEKREAEEKENRDKREGEVTKQEKSEAEKNADGEDKLVESTHDKIGLLEDSPLDQDAVDDNIDPATEVEHMDASKNEGSFVNGHEQHATEEKTWSVSPTSKDDVAIVSETGSDAGSKVSTDQDMEVKTDMPENSEELSREELGRLVASRWTGENTEKKTVEVDGAKDNDHVGHEEVPEDSHDEEYDGYASATDDDTGKYDDDTGKYDDDHLEDEMDESYEEDIHDDTTSSYKSDSDDELNFPGTSTESKPSWLAKIQQTVKNILQAVNLFQAPVNISEAAHVRKEYEDSSAKLSKIQSRISSLTQKLKHDFGPEKEFYSFYGQCFESKQNKLRKKSIFKWYVYKVCPFKQASQVEGHSTTRLGHWEKFEDSYRVMVFSNGDKCWNGPDRSLKVKLRCGLNGEITDVDEPSRCEYVALLSTPAFCSEEKLKELQHKLDMMSKEQPERHDEL